jgi:NAD(P)H-dependent flavin oxidoreductase YrpB (nitropropane dioxygenase family)
MRSSSPQGMNVAAGPELAAAVTNGGGIGVIGGVG